jgi:hypothetical protein
MPCFGISLQVSLQLMPRSRGVVPRRGRAVRRACAGSHRGESKGKQRRLALFFFAWPSSSPPADPGRGPAPASLLPPSAWGYAWAIAAGRWEGWSGREGAWRTRSLTLTEKRAPFPLSFTGCLRRLRRRPAARLPRLPALAVPEGAARAGAAGHAARCAQGVFEERERETGPRPHAPASGALLFLSTPRTLTPCKPSPLPSRSSSCGGRGTRASPRCGSRRTRSR